MTAVYCQELTGVRSRYFTKEMDAFLRSEYFPGLAVSALVADFRRRFPHPGRSGMQSERCIANRLSELGLRRKRG